MVITFTHTYTPYKHVNNLKAAHQKQSKLVKPHKKKQTPSNHTASNQNCTTLRIFKIILLIKINIFVYNKRVQFIVLCISFLRLDRSALARNSSVLHKVSKTMLHQVSRTVLHRTSKTVASDLKDSITLGFKDNVVYQVSKTVSHQVSNTVLFISVSKIQWFCDLLHQVSNTVQLQWLFGGFMAASKYSGSVTCHNVVVTSGLKDSIRPVSDGFIVTCRCYGSVLHQSCMKTTMTCIAFEAMHSKLYNKSYMNLVRFQNYSNVTAMLRLFLRFRVTKNVSSR